MFEVVKSKLIASRGPISGAVRNGPFLMTSVIPKDPDTGDIVQGDMKVQARRVLDNLGLTMEAAGGSLADVMMIQVSIADPNDLAAMNEVWNEVFSAPYPGRATVVVKQLLLPGMRIEIVVTAMLGPVA